MIELEKDGNIHVATMNNKENMISPQWQDRMLEILDIVESDCAAGAAMVLIGEDKFFCNGLDLETVMDLDQPDSEEFGRKMREIHRLSLIHI